MLPNLTQPVTRTPVGAPAQAGLSPSFDPFLMPFEGDGVCQSWDPRGGPGSSPFFEG